MYSGRSWSGGGYSAGKRVHTISWFNLTRHGEVCRLWALVQVKMQSAVGEMGDSHGPKAKPDVSTEVLPGMD